MNISIRFSAGHCETGLQSARNIAFNRRKACSMQLQRHLEDEPRSSSKLIHAPKFTISSDDLQKSVFSFTLRKNNSPDLRVTIYALFRLQDISITRRERINLGCRSGIGTRGRFQCHVDPSYSARRVLPKIYRSFVGGFAFESPSRREICK